MDLKDKSQQLKLRKAQTMECPYCNTENRDGVRYCANCGRQLDQADSTQPAAVGPAVAVPTSHSLTPGSRLQGGRYVIKKVLGQGGMGAALLATDLRLDSKPVVIKELVSDNTDPAKVPDDVRNFKREVATLAHIDHPLVPNVTDHCQEGPRYFMVQEFVDGEKLPVRSLNPQLSPHTERVLNRALVSDINQRYQRAAAMKPDLYNILQNRYGVM